MEGNACYKLSTVRNFVEATGAPGIRRIVEVGVNIGEVTCLLHEYFPKARIVGFEPVEEYFNIALQRTRSIGNVELYRRAVTSAHLFSDDIGCSPRDCAAKLAILKGLPAAGPGWRGGSAVVPANQVLKSEEANWYERLSSPVDAVSLDGILELTGFAEIDYMKMDCEGCEHSTLGCASEEALRRVRYIGGEYHNIQRFYAVMNGKLFKTHKVSLVGDRRLGAFFAERLEGEKDGILRFDRSRMLLARPWLGDTPIQWNIFNEDYVLPVERPWHGLA